MATWKEKFNKKYNHPKGASHSLSDISKETGVSKKGIQQIYNKGIGAYKTNPQSVRPNVTSKEQWAYARVYSSVMGGKASKVDAKELKMQMGGSTDDFNRTDFYKGYYERLSPSNFIVERENEKITINMDDSYKSGGKVNFNVGAVDVHDEADVLVDGIFEKGGLAKGYHKMPDGTIMKDSDHYAKGGTIECGSCDWSWDKKDGGDDMYICHKCGADNEQLRILNKSIDVTDSSGTKGLVSLKELEPFVGEDRVGDASMINSRENIDKLKTDIKKNGFKEPIIVLYDRFSNGGEATIIEGNHRFVVAKELGFKEIPVTFEKGSIRSNEKRAKDQMFPLNRKYIGFINDTRGISGKDLGLNVRQPNENDYVKETSFALGGKFDENYDYDSYTTFDDEKQINITNGVQYILVGEYTLVARSLYLKDKELFYYYKYLQRLNITLEDCQKFALSLNEVFTNMVCQIKVEKLERKKRSNARFQTTSLRLGGSENQFQGVGTVNGKTTYIQTDIRMACCKAQFLERLSKKPLPANNLNNYYSFQVLLHELAHCLDFQFQFIQGKIPVPAHKDYFMEAMYKLISACKDGKLPLAKSFGIRAKALKRMSILTKGKI